MNTIPDEAITKAIQYIGMRDVQRLQQELVEGMRDGEPRGYPALRKLLEQLDAVTGREDDV